MELLFWAIAILTIGAGVLTILSKTNYHALLLFLLSMAGVAAIDFILQAEDVALSFFFICLAVSLLGIFVVFKRNQKVEKRTIKKSIPIVISGIILLGLNVYSVWSTQWNTSSPGLTRNSQNQIPELLMNYYGVAFLLLGILVLIVLIGLAVQREGVDREP